MPISNKDEVQIIKNLWKEYGYYLVFTIVFFLLINFGWQYWQRNKYSNREFSSTLYMQMLSALEQQKSKDVELFGEKLLKDYPRSPYSSFAALVLAKEAVNKEDLKLAKERLDFVSKKAPNKKLRQLAKIRLARVLIEMKKPNDALDLLSKVDDKDYLPQASEVFGDALLVLGKHNEAEQSYRKALRLSEEQNLPMPLVKLKLQQF